MKRQRPAPYTLKQYRVKVKHDHGAQVIRTAAENEAALPQAELFPRPPVEMRTAKRPTTPSPYPTTPALFAEACQWGEYQTEGE